MNAENVVGVSSRSAGRWLVVTGVVLALASAVAMILPGIGYRLDLWHFRTGFTIMRWAFWFGAAGAVLSLLGLIVTGARSPKLLAAALIGIVVGAILLGLLALVLYFRRSIAGWFAPISPATGFVS